MKPHDPHAGADTLLTRITSSVLYPSHEENSLSYSNNSGLWPRFILTGFYAAKLDRNTHVWIYTSHRCSFLHDSTIVYNDNSNKWRQRKEENARRAAGHSRVLFTGCRSLFQASFFQIYCHLSHYIREVEMHPPLIWPTQKHSERIHGPQSWITVARFPQPVCRLMTGHQLKLLL